MRINLRELLFKSNNGYYEASASYARFLLIASIFLYSIFGILDVYMLPKTYLNAWFIRYYLMLPILVISFILTYSKKYSYYNKFILTFIIITAQLGICAMMFFAEPNEPGYKTYYAGLILCVLWGLIIFRLSIPEVVLTTATNIIFYNSLGLLIQKRQLISIDPNANMHYLLNNNFFLVSASLLAVLGALLINYYKNKIKDQNKILKKEAKALIKAKKRAEESDRLKSVFLANLSHEIRSPMNAIMGFSEILKNHTLIREKKEQYLNIIISKGNQLLNLLSDIMDMSKLETNHIEISPTPNSLNEILDELYIIYQQLISTTGKEKIVKLNLEKYFSDSECRIMIDKNRFKQIMSNLLDNAVKFTNRGEISFGYSLIAERELLFYVRDNGIGIPQDKQKVIFDYFRQADEKIMEKYGGTGLGLSIAKNLIELSDGRIWLNSNEGIGTEFFFTIPFHPVNEDIEGLMYEKAEV